MVTRTKHLGRFTHALRFYSRNRNRVVIARKGDLTLSLLEEQYYKQEAKDLLTHSFAVKNPLNAGKVLEQDWQPYVSQLVDMSIPEQISFVVTDDVKDRLAHAMVSHDLCNKVDVTNMNFSQYRVESMKLLRALSGKWKDENEKNGPGRALYMDLGATHEDYYRQGIQPWTIQTTLERAREHGYKVAAMQTTNPTNHRIGERLGFEIVNQIQAAEFNPLFSPLLVTLWVYKL
jgi:GNAT superfamily N-acetyltransferase